jgi:dipeptidase D
LKGKYLLNLDSESEGILTVSCAGGSMTTVTLPFTRSHCDGTVYKVTFSGLLGGHSGAEIHKGRANAAVLLGEFLEQCGGKLISAYGGCADNAIMSSLTAEIVCGDVMEAAKTCQAKFRERFPEENITLTVNDTLTVTYSPMQYISRMYGKTESAELKALVSELYQYHLTAVDYLADPYGNDKDNLVSAQ